MAASAPRLTERTYRQLRTTTETAREELLVRLCGEVGLQTGEIVRVCAADLDAERGGWFLRVREADGGVRRAYVPDGVAREIRRYRRSEGLAEDDPLVGVTPRRVQMLLGAVADRAAERTGQAAFREVTPSTLRRWFGRRLLTENGVDVRVVTAVGGWQGVDELVGSLDPPSRDEIREAFTQLEAGETAAADRLEALVPVLAAVDAALFGATSREELDERVCGRLTELYPAVWVAERAPTQERITIRAHAGESPGRFEGAGSSALVRRALQTGRTLVAPDDPGPASPREGRGLLAAAPLAHGETNDGCLVVRAHSAAAFDDPERTALSALGRRIAFAVTALERKQLLVGDSVVELQFRYSDETAPLVGLSARLDCTLTLSGLIPGADDSLVCFLELDETTAEAVLETAPAIQGVAETRPVRRDADGGVIEVVLDGSSPLRTLTERGGTVTALRVEGGVASLGCEFAPDTDVRAVHDELGDQVPSVELRRKQKQAARETPDFRSTFEEEFTAKQRAVLEGAYHAGYFEWPRGSTAEELAESMGISSPTFHNHLRRAQGKLLAALFENDR